jgi:BioD-like phosphotransacetylase family protein
LSSAKARATPGVGAVFDLSNAQVAKHLGCKAIIVSRGGIGKPIDEVALNQALFEKEGVEIIGVIINKVLPDKVDYIADFARRGLKRKGLELLGVIPHQPMLESPTVDSIREELDAELLNTPATMHGLVDDVVVGAMSAQNAVRFFKRGVLLITPGDREDILATAAAMENQKMAGIVLTGGLKPGNGLLRSLREMQSRSCWPKTTAIKSPPRSTTSPPKPVPPMRKRSNSSATS